MRLSEWRTGLLSWLAPRVPVHSYLLDPPESPGDTVGFVPPLKNIEIEASLPGSLKATAVQEVFYQAAYGKEVAYGDLPVGALEGLYQSVAIALVSGFSMLHPDLQDLEIVATPEPVTVAEQVGPLGAWVVTVMWVFRLTYPPEQEVDFEVNHGPIYFDPSQPLDLNVVVEKEKLNGDWTTSKPDWEMTIRVN